MPRTIRSLVVDDKQTARDSMAITLERMGHQVDEASDGSGARDLLEKNTYDLVLTDMQMPVAKGEDPSMETGIQVVEDARRLSPHSAVIVMTAYGSIENSVEVVKRGANDYATKPVSVEEIKIKVKKALHEVSLKHENIRLVEENLNLRGQLEGKYEFSNIVGTSEKMKSVLSLVARAARFPDTVLIQGESGTGKELVARAIHYNSPRCEGPFVADNCAAIAETLQESHFFGHEKGAFTDARTRQIGRFEQAKDGSLFLDEIGDMSLAAQSKLLRVLESGEFERVGGAEIIRTDVRIVAATNKDLLAEVERKTFREDLFARLDVIPIRIPPLRTRKDDIPVLAEHFIEELTRKRGIGPAEISPEAMKKMIVYDWPRNVRELRNVLKRSLVFADGRVILPSHIQFSSSSGNENLPGDETPGSLREAKQMWEKEFLLQTLRDNDWNVKTAAGKLDIQRTYLWKKIKDLEIDVENQC